MKRHLTSLNHPAILLVLFGSILLSGLLGGCRKGDGPPFFPRDDAGKYSSDVIDKWMSMQIRLERDATGIANVAFERYYAYSGVAAFESIAPGTELGTLLKWNGLDSLPGIDRSKRYFWPASINASLAAMNRSIFTAASATDKAAIDSLENALNTSFLSGNNAELIQRSSVFGKSIGVAVFNWSETDGYHNDSDPYTSPVGPGLWTPTPPAFAKASTPYFGNNRPMVSESTDDTQPGAPLAYSEDPSSPFFKMVKQVYDASQNLTADQTADALFWRDVPGVTTAGHWLSILQQVIKQTNTHLDLGAFAYAITGACQNDASISCWKTKYQYTLVRPITYIRNVMGFTTWNSLLTTPAHPEYSSAHAVISSAAADAFTAIFGNIGNFTDHTYDYLGFAPRTFPTFRAIGEDAGNSRLYAGIHYQPSIDAGLIQGRLVASHILQKFHLVMDGD